MGENKYIDLIGDSSETHGKPEFSMLTAKSTDLTEILGELDKRFPL